MNNNLISGLFLSAIGLIFLIYSTEYELGSLRNIGPGWFPLIISSMLFVFGFIIALSSIRSPQQTSFDFKSLAIVSIGIFLFSLTIESVGLLVSVLGIVVVFSFLLKVSCIEKILLTLGITGFTFILFSFVLEISIKLW